MTIEFFGVLVKKMHTTRKMHIFGTIEFLGVLAVAIEFLKSSRQKRKVEKGIQS